MQSNTFTLGLLLSGVMGVATAAEPARAWAQDYGDDPSYRYDSGYGEDPAYEEVEDSPPIERQPVARLSSGRPGVIVTREQGPGRDLHLSLLGVRGSYYGEFTTGGGVLFGVPLVSEGLVRGLNDALYFDGGLLIEVVIVNGNGRGLLRPVAGVRYEVAFTDKLSTYVAARTGPSIGLDQGSSTEYFLGGMFGGHYHFSDKVAFRGEFGGGTATGFATKAGVSFFF
jgi:hypothetical protein